MAIGCCKCNKTRADYSSLPDDITEHILLKLQCIKSIVTCMSVCKSWHSLIKSLRFVKIHLSSSYNSKECFFCFYVQPLRCYSVDYYESERLHKYSDLKFPHEGTTYLFGSSNGLICYAKCDGAILRNIYMWNPAIRKLRTLPKSEFYMKPSAYGFWFATDTDDYKVAKISYTKVEVYSLSTNTWDTIFSSGPTYSSVQYSPIIDINVVHLNGTLHWLLFKENGWNIMSLNIKIRKLHETLILPIENEGYFLDLLTSETHNHSLFVLRYDSLWKCRVLAYDESLRELYRIDLEESGIKARLIGVRNNGIEFLFQKMCNNDGGILVCDVEDFKFKDFSPSIGTIFKLYPFAETLVLLNDKDSSSTANSSVIRNMVLKARFFISRIFYAVEKAIGNSF